MDVIVIMIVFIMLAFFVRTFFAELHIRIRYDWNNVYKLFSVNRCVSFFKTIVQMTNTNIGLVHIKANADQDKNQLLSQSRGTSITNMKSC